MENATTTLVIQLRYDEKKYDGDDCLYEIRQVLRDMNPEYDWEISSLRSEIKSEDGKRRSIPN